MPVSIRPASTPIKEYDVLSVDGTDYVLHGPGGRSVLTDTGWGMPEIEYVTVRGPFQDGESVKGAFLRPRVVEYHIRQNGCSREEYWRLRAALLDILRPNRGFDMVLTKYLPNGTKRALNVAAQSGPKFEGKKQGTWDEYSIEEVIRLIAFNPVVYDPVQKSVAFNQSGGLSFPITFPITFGAQGGSASIVYAGTWKEYPTITLYGPMNSVSIVNALTNERIGFTGYSIADGRYVTITLQYGAKSVLLDDGTSLMGYITPSSDLGTFHLEPGTNLVSVTASGLGANSSVVLSYYERYLGI